MKMARPGNKASHHARKFSFDCASRLPQETVSGGRPMPKKVSDDSAMMVAEIPKVMATIIGVMALGRMCFLIM